MNAYRELMRRKLLEEVYEGLSPEDKRLFVQLTMQDKSWSEIAQALQQQQAQLKRIEKNQNWAVDIGSDIAANFISDGLIWLGSKLFKKL
jgi:hypothetical protein